MSFEVVKITWNQKKDDDDDAIFEGYNLLKAKFRASETAKTAFFDIL